MDDKDLKFRKEANWCLEQLRMGILNKNPTQKQVKECERVIKILTSSKASMVKKRQAMHQMFGDYRKKIELEEKAWENETLKQLQNIKITDVSSSQGTYFRVSKAAEKRKDIEKYDDEHNKSGISNNNLIKEDSDKNETKCNGNLSLTNTFKFNFDVST